MSRTAYLKPSETMFFQIETDWMYLLDFFHSFLSYPFTKFAMKSILSIVENSGQTAGMKREKSHL